MTAKGAFSLVESVGMQTKQTNRMWLVSACLIMGVVALLGASWMAADRVFKTQYRFIHHVRNERFDDAKAMIHPTDRDKIPEVYWEQFRGHPPDSLRAPTPLVFIGGRMAMRVTLPGYKTTNPDIRYVVVGRQIRVRELTWARPQR